MDYTLTRIDPNNPQKRYPEQSREAVGDPLEDQVHKNIYMGKLEDMLHGAVNGGVKTLYGLITLVCHVAMLKWQPLLLRRTI